MFLKEITEKTKTFLQLYYRLKTIKKKMNNKWKNNNNLNWNNIF